MHRLIVIYDQPMDPEAFHLHYREVHLPLVSRVPNLRRLTTTSLGSTSGPSMIVEMWFDDRQAMKDAMGSSEMRAAADDGENIDTSHVILAGEMVDHPLTAI